MQIKINLPIDNIIQLYTIQKLSAAKIAKRYEVSICTITQRLRENNIPIRQVNLSHNHNSAHKIIMSDNTIKDIIRLYSIEHLSSVTIGKQFGISNPVILRIMRANNIPILDSRHDKSHMTNSIDLSKIPSFIANVHRMNNKLIGEITCPNCNETRTLTLSSLRIKEISSRNGVCQHCSGNVRRSKIFNIVDIKKLYEINRLTPRQIGIKYHVSDMTIRNLLSENNINMRTRGELNKIIIINKGSLKSPVLGDTCRGVDIGLNCLNYYVWVSCPKCSKERWQSKSLINRSQLCRKCTMKRLGESQRGDNSPAWLGGISFEPYTKEFNKSLKVYIRERDNRTCQLCGRKENGIKLAVHHIDYDKKHSTTDNLISLCGSEKMLPSCHNKTNHNRKYWTKYFTDLLIARGIIILSS